MVFFLFQSKIAAKFESCLSRLPNQYQFTEVIDWKDWQLHASFHQGNKARYEQKMKKERNRIINQSIREAFCIILSINHQLKIQYVNGQLYKNEIVLKENVFGYVERTKKRETNYADQLYFAVIRSNRCKSESNYYSVRKVCEWKENKCNVQEKRPVLIRNRINLNQIISSSFFISVFFSLPFFGSRATLATRIQGANVVLDFFLELRHLFIFLVFKTSMLVGGWNLNTKCYIWWQMVWIMW